MCWYMWRSLACPSTSRTLFSGLRVSTHGKQVAPYSVRFLLTSQEGGVGPILPRVPHGAYDIVTDISSERGETLVLSLLAVRGTEHFDAVKKVNTNSKINVTASNDPVETQTQRKQNNRKTVVCLRHIKVHRLRKSNYFVSVSPIEMNGKETRTKSVAVLEKTTSQVLAKTFQKGVKAN